MGLNFEGRVIKKKIPKRNLRCAVVGYGPAFNMGKAHCGWIRETEGLDLVAVCDIDPRRTAVAKHDFPWIKTYNSVSEMLCDAEINLVTIATPHNTHAEITLQCLEAKKHVIVEKPMCLTVEEATAMIEKAKESDTMLTVFHNRRLDGDFLAIKEVVEKGLIGDIFHVEMFAGSYGHPGYWWRSNKKISGGAFYDWGAHMIDWLLNIVPGRVAGVAGFFHKLVWKDVSNEDQVEAMILFDSGRVANVQVSSLARVGKPRWRILGTKGAILDQGGGKLKVVTEVQGIPAEMEVKYKDSDWGTTGTSLTIFSGARIST